MLTDEKFYERATKFMLLKNADGKLYTFADYKTLIEANQTDKDGNLVYLYASNRDEQYTYIKDAQDKGYDVLILDGTIGWTHGRIVGTEVREESFCSCGRRHGEQPYSKRRKLKTRFV